MQPGVKLALVSFPVVEHTGQVFNFYNESLLVLVYEAEGVASRRVVSRRIAGDGTKERLSVSHERLDVLAWRVCNINKFAAKTRPRRAIPEGSAGATRKRRTRGDP